MRQSIALILAALSAACGSAASGAQSSSGGSSAVLALGVTHTVQQGGVQFSYPKSWAVRDMAACYVDPGDHPIAEALVGPVAAPLQQMSCDSNFAHAGLMLFQLADAEDQNFCERNGGTTSGVTIDGLTGKRFVYRSDTEKEPAGTVHNYVSLCYEFPSKGYIFSYGYASDQADVYGGGLTNEDLTPTFEAMVASVKWVPGAASD